MSSNHKNILLQNKIKLSTINPCIKLFFFVIIIVTMPCITCLL